MSGFLLCNAIQTARSFPLAQQPWVLLAAFLELSSPLGNSLVQLQQPVQAPQYVQHSCEQEQCKGSKHHQAAAPASILVQNACLTSYAWATQQSRLVPAPQARSLYSTSAKASRPATQGRQDGTSRARHQSSPSKPPPQTPQAAPAIEQLEETLTTVVEHCQQLTAAPNYKGKQYWQQQHEPAGARYTNHHSNLGEHWQPPLQFSTQDLLQILDRQVRACVREHQQVTLAFGSTHMPPLPDGRQRQPAVLPVNRYLILEALGAAGTMLFKVTGGARVHQRKLNLNPLTSPTIQQSTPDENNPAAPALRGIRAALQEATLIAQRAPSVGDQPAEQGHAIALVNTLIDILLLTIPPPEKVTWVERWIRWPFHKALTAALALKAAGADVPVGLQQPLAAWLRVGIDYMATQDGITWATLYQAAFGMPPPADVFTPLQARLQPVLPQEGVQKQGLYPEHAPSKPGFTAGAALAPSASSPTATMTPLPPPPPPLPPLPLTGQLHQTDAAAREIRQGRPADLQGKAEGERRSPDDSFIETFTDRDGLFSTRTPSLSALGQVTVQLLRARREDLGDELSTSLDLLQRHAHQLSADEAAAVLHQCLWVRPRRGASSAAERQPALLRTLMRTVVSSSTGELRPQQALWALQAMEAILLAPPRVDQGLHQAVQRDAAGEMSASTPARDLEESPDSSHAVSAHSTAASSPSLGTPLPSRITAGYGSSLQRLAQNVAAAAVHQLTASACHQPGSHLRLLADQLPAALNKLKALNPRAYQDEYMQSCVSEAVIALSPHVPSIPYLARLSWAAACMLSPGFEQHFLSPPSQQPSICHQQDSSGRARPASPVWWVLGSSAINLLNRDAAAMVQSEWQLDKAYEVSARATTILSVLLYSREDQLAGRVLSAAAPIMSGVLEWQQSSGAGDVSPYKSGGPNTRWPVLSEMRGLLAAGRAAAASPHLTLASHSHPHQSQQLDIRDQPLEQGGVHSHSCEGDQEQQSRSGAGVSDAVHNQEEQGRDGRHQLYGLLSRVLLRFNNQTKMWGSLHFIHMVGAGTMIDMLYCLARIRQGVLAAQQQQPMPVTNAADLLRNIHTASRIIAASMPPLLQQHPPLPQEMCRHILLALAQLSLGSHPAATAALAATHDLDGSEGQLSFEGASLLVNSLLWGTQGSGGLSAQQLVELVQGVVSQGGGDVAAHLPAAALKALPVHVFQTAQEAVLPGAAATQAFRLGLLTSLLQTLHQAAPITSAELVGKFNSQERSAPAVTSPLQNVTATTMKAWVQVCSAELQAAQPNILLQTLQTCAQLQQAVKGSSESDSGGGSDALWPVFVAAARSLQPHLPSLSLQQLAQAAVHISSAPVQIGSASLQDHYEAWGDDTAAEDTAALQQLTAFYDSVAAQVHGRLHELYTMPAHEVPAWLSHISTARLCTSTVLAEIAQAISHQLPSMQPQDLVDITLAVSAAQIHLNSPPPPGAQRTAGQSGQQDSQQPQKPGRGWLFSDAQAQGSKDQASHSRLRWFVDDLIAAVVKHLPTLSNQQLASLVALTSELPATQSRLFLRALARELAAKAQGLQPHMLVLLCEEFARHERKESLLHVAAAQVASSSALQFSVDELCRLLTSCYVAGVRTHTPFSQLVTALRVHAAQEFERSRELFKYTGENLAPVSSTGAASKGTGSAGKGGGMGVSTQMSEQLPSGLSPRQLQAAYNVLHALGHSDAPVFQKEFLRRLKHGP